MGGGGQVPLLCVPDALAGVWELLEKNLLEGIGGTFPMPTHLLPQGAAYLPGSPYGWFCSPVCSQKKEHRLASRVHHTVHC